MTSLYAQYIREREGKHCLETKDGFATYSLHGEECYIEDIYVVPEKRKSSVASVLADNISEAARAAGCKYLTGSVCPAANGATASLKVLLGYGFQLLRSDKDLIYFIKEL